MVAVAAVDRVALVASAVVAEVVAVVVAASEAAALAAASEADAHRECKVKVKSKKVKKLPHSDYQECGSFFTYTLFSAVVYFLLFYLFTFLPLIFLFPVVDVVALSGSKFLFEVGEAGVHQDVIPLDELLDVAVLNALLIPVGQHLREILV